MSNILNEIVQKGLSNINGNTTEILSLIETIKKPALLYSIAVKKLIILIAKGENLKSCNLQSSDQFD